MKTIRRAYSPLVDPDRAGCAGKCVACPEAVDVMHALIGADLTSLTIRELSTFLEFESKYREGFGQEALFMVEVEIARLGKQGARCFVRALLDQDAPPESVEVALARSSLNAAREKHKELASAGHVPPMRMGMAVSTRERVDALVGAWKFDGEAHHG